MTNEQTELPDDLQERYEAAFSLKGDDYVPKGEIMKLLVLILALGIGFQSCNQSPAIDEKAKRCARPCSKPSAGPTPTPRPVPKLITH